MILFSFVKSGEVSKRLLGAVPVAAIAYVITVVISITLHLSLDRDLLTTQVFCVSVFAQLVGILICSVMVNLRCRPLDEMSSVYAGAFLVLSAAFFNYISRSHSLYQYYNVLGVLISG